MAELCGIYLWLVGVGIAIWMISDYLRGKHDLLSYRNIFLVSFILNQCHAPADTLFYDNWWGHFKVYNKDAVGIEACILTTAFVFIFAFSYKFGWGAKGIASSIKVPSFDPTTRQLLFIALAMTAFGAAVRPGLHILPKVMAVLSYYSAVGFSAIACGLVGWAVGSKLKNPGYWVIGIVMVAINLAIVSSGWTRRPLAAVFAALIWGFYYSYWRYQRPFGVMAKLVGVSIVPILLLASFTSIRQGGRFDDRSLGNVINRMITQGDTLQGLRRLGSGDFCGPAELWCIENFTEQYQPKHLFSLRFFFMINIPRSIWPNKPDQTLSNEITKMVRMQGADRKAHSFGAGVIGYAAAEGGPYALVVYGICLAFFVRFYDSLVQTNILNPFLVVPVAAGIGELLGLARGDMSLFANTIVIEVLFGLAVTMTLALCFATRGVPAMSSMLGSWKSRKKQPSARQVITVWVPAEWAARQEGRG
jgi:hypothetical protein